MPTATNSCSSVAPNGLAPVSGVMLSAKRNVCAPGVAAMTFNNGDVCGQLFGIRVGFTGRTPIAILSGLLIPALNLISVAICRHNCCALFRASSLVATVTGDRCAGSIASA